MKNKIIIGLMCIILSLSLICAADFTPQGNITLRNVYNIQNATSITIGNGSVYANPNGWFGPLNWSWIQNAPNFGNIYVPYTGANQTVYLNNQTLEIMNTKGANVTLNNFVEHTQEMMTDTLLDKSRSTLSCVDGVLNYTLIAVGGCGQFNFNATLYPISGSPCVKNATVSLLNGTDVLPKNNYVYWELVGDTPTMKTATSPGASGTIPVAEFKVGTTSGTSYTIYSYSRSRSEVDTFVNRVLMRFEDMGTLYKSGFTINPATTNIKIDSGYFYNGIFQMYTNVSLNSSVDGFYWINSTGNFKNATSFTGSINRYQTGEAITNGRELNIVWGIVPTSTTASGTAPTTPRLVAVVQSKPATEYNSVALAEQDLYLMTNYYPNDVQIKEVFVPIARQVVNYNSAGAGSLTAQTLSNGLLYIDLRGKTTSSGGSPTPTTSDHATLTNLDYASSGHTGFLATADWNSTNTSYLLKSDWNSTNTSYLLKSDWNSTNTSYATVTNVNTNVTTADLHTHGWANLTVFPAVCSANTFLTAVNTSTTCSSISTLINNLNVAVYNLTWTSNNKVWDNSTCVIIQGSTSTIYVC